MKPSERLKQLNMIGRLDVVLMQQAITELLLAHPELEEDEVLRADTIEGETETFTLLSKLVRLVGQAKVLELGTAAYIAELQSRKARFERRQDALRGLVLKLMNTAELTKMELPEATLSIRAGTPKVVIVDETQIPEEYCRVKIEPDKIKIKAALITTGSVPGAMLSNAEPVLAILTK